MDEIRVGIIGDRDSIYGFASVGLDVFFASEPSEASVILHRLAGSGYGVIYITEALASEMKEELSKYLDSPTPAIIPVPGLSGNTGIGMARLSDWVEKAVGMDIL